MKLNLSTYIKIIGDSFFKEKEETDFRRFLIVIIGLLMEIIEGLRFGVGSEIGLLPEKELKIQNLIVLQ